MLSWGLLVLTGASASGEVFTEMGLIFILIGALFFLAGEVMASCVIHAGSFLKQRRNYRFCFVTSCILCVLFPIGTVLGIFTLLVLSRDSVKQLYGRT